MKTHIDTIRSINEKGGTRHMLVYQNWIHTRGYGDVPGIKEVFDENGNRVNTTDLVSFQIVVTGEVFTKV